MTNLFYCDNCALKRNLPLSEDNATIGKCDYCNNTSLCSPKQIKITEKGFLKTFLKRLFEKSK